MASWHDPNVIAACLSAVAALAAAVATWRGPLSAARMAESLRRSAEIQSDKRRFKLNVFTSVMQERAQIWSDEAVRALNSIDVAFSDNNEVREAWAELHLSLGHKDIRQHGFEDKLRALLRSMAADLGIADKLRLDDFGRVYFPTALAEERRVRDLERQASLARLTVQAASNSDVTQTGEPPLWPPKPET